MSEKGHGRKLSLEDLPGKTEQRVFVGGQYDFMPTLRAIAKFVTDVSTPEARFFPVIPFDYEIGVEETMDRDIQILNGCRYAIFDLSDLGAQLVEMQEAKHRYTSIETLLVYPVRERRNEPERGRRTVLSFGLPHFGYSTLNELKGIVWRFLMNAPTEKDYSPRHIYDPMLDLELRRSRVFLGEGNTKTARERIEALRHRYAECLELWLHLALIYCWDRDRTACQQALEKGTVLAKNNDDNAEVLYYTAVVKRLESNRPPWETIRDHLLAAEKLKPTDGRVLQMLGYAFWKTKDLNLAIEKSRKALDDRDIPDPVVAIQAINNLAYFLCEKHQREKHDETHLEEALSLSQYLPAYQKVFRRRSVSWLDTRGWILMVGAKHMAKGHRLQAAKEALREALGLLSEAHKTDKNHRFATKHLKEARRLDEKLSKR